MNINLPVSLGEALDKLTILDIKKEKIKDNRLKDVENEYNILYEKLKEYINKFKYYYTILKNINLNIWEMQDEFRYNNDNNNKSKLCFKIIEENDRRFRVKKKINNLTKSNLKEQKGYKKRKAFVLTHLGLGDNITAIGMVRYLSTCYDEVKVVCKTRNRENLELFYGDDTSIKIYDVNNDKNISPKLGFNINKFKKITEGYDLYLTGAHNFKRGFNINTLPFCFYEQINLDPQILWSYFHIPILNESINLYNNIKNNKYIFIHNTASTGNVFSIELVEKKLNINRNDIIFINPCKNIYSKNHKFYNLANKFINHKLSYYTETIKNANYNIFSDSSFMCMALNLEIKNKNNYYISRDNRNYNLLYNNKYVFKNVNRQKFILL